MGKNFFNIKNGLSVEGVSSTPTNLQNGDVYYDSVRNTLVHRSNGSSVDLQSLSSVASAANLTSTQFTSLVIQSSVIKVTGAIPSNVHGLTASSNAKQFILYNSSSADITIVYDSVTEATAANRVITATGDDTAVAAGQCAFFFYDSAQSRWVLASVSGGSGGITLDTIFAFTADDPISAWATGNNATFMGGGTMQGNLGIISGATVINGDFSYRYNVGAVPGITVNDYFAIPAQDIPLKFRGQRVVWTFCHTNNMAGTSLAPVAFDATNNTVLNAVAIDRVPQSGTLVDTYKMYFDIPASCQQLRLGYHVKSAPPANSSITFDDLLVTSQLALYLDVYNITNWTNFPSVAAGTLITATTTAPSYGGTVLNNKARWRRVGDTMEIEWDFSQSTAGTAGSGTYLFNLPPGYTIDTSQKPDNNSTAINALSISSVVGKLVVPHGTANMQIGDVSVYSPTQLKVTLSQGFNGTNTNTRTWGSGGTETFATAIYSCYLQAKVPISGWQAEESSVVTASDQINSSNLAFSYAGSGTYTLSTLPNSPLGTFITWTYGGGSNTLTQTNAAAPTQSASDMAVNGIQMFTRIYSASSTAASPARVAINIGKDYESITINAYKDTTKALKASLDFASSASGDTEYGLTFKDYNKLTGILVLDLGFNYTSLTTNKLLTFTDGSAQNNGYITFTAAKHPAVVGMPIERYQIKTLPGNTGTSGTISALSFNNLVVGRVYRITLQCNAYSNQNSGAPNGIAAVHNGVTLCRTGISASVPLYNFNQGVTATFVAVVPTLIVTGVNLNGAKQVFGAGTQDGTFSMLEELVSAPTNAFT